MTTMNLLSRPSGNCALEGHRCGTLTSPVDLMPVVQRVVGEIADEALVPVAAATRGLAFQPRSLLALLTYCYASGTYGSQEVETSLRKDSILRFLCANELPDWHTLRRFRRHNREVLIRCLEQTLSCTNEERNLNRMGLGADGRLSNRFDVDQAAAEEAASRIQQAIWLDSVALAD